MPNREALFISHATPEHNAFARWLGAKLGAMGYEVWADVMRLRGGADWARLLEEALRNRSVKLLVACAPKSMDKQGVRNEIEIGAELAKELSDPEFTIPLRLEPYKPHVRIAQAQYIDFSSSWATGLAELVDLLINVHKIPRSPGRDVGDWLASQSDGATRLIPQQERLESNWLRVQSAPNNLYYCEPPSGFPLERFHARGLHTSPVVPVGNGVLTFAEPGGDGLIAPDMPATALDRISLEAFLSDGWERLGIVHYDARRQFSDLGNQAFEKYLNSRGLSPFEGANKRLSWWGAIGTAPLTKVRFNWPEQKGLRQIIGQSKKRGIHWHYAISGQLRSAPVQHLRVFSRLVFSENGKDAITDAKLTHRLRRSFAKSWRNARWRDMLSAFLWWVSEGKNHIAMPVSQTRYLVLELPPMSFDSPVKVLHPGDAPPDDDDPDVDESELDEDDDPDEQVTVA